MEYKKRGSFDNLTTLLDNRMKNLNIGIREIKNLKEAAAIIKNAIDNNRHIHIVGDYDVDGICATAIMVKGIQWMISAQKSMSTLAHRLPRRQSEGYGLSPKIVDEIPENALLLTVDNGIVAFDAIEKAKAKKMTVIVTDHHLRSDSGELPNADLIIDPNAIPGQCEFTGYCGAGLALKLMTELLGQKHPLSQELSVLAATATIADVVPLRDENFLIASFFRMASVNYGLNALIQLFGIEELTEKDFGYKICPALNAAGRLLDDGAEKSLSCLLATNPETAMGIATALFSLNEERKDNTENSVMEAERIIKEQALYGDNPLCICGDFHEGLIGIIAGKMAEKYSVPTFVFTPTKTLAEDGTPILKGSGRTAGDNNLKVILDACKDVLSKYGGHSAAAGVSLPESKLSAFQQKAAEFCQPMDTTEVIEYDLEMDCNNLEDHIRAAYTQLSTCAPYGEGNAEVVFLIENVQLLPRGGKTYKLMGKNEQHLKLFGAGVDFVAFDLADTFFASNQPSRIDLIGMVSMNFYKGESIPQIEVLHFRPVKKKEIKSKARDLLASRAKERSL